MLPSQVIIGTGGGQGTGKAVALGAFAEGAAVAVVDLNAEAAQAVARQILDPGGRAVACSADMSASDSNIRVFDRAEAGLGPVAGLVCAGVRRHYAPAELMTDEQWDVVIGDGLTGYFRSAREAARRMLPHGHGSIVFVTSTPARSAIVNGAA